MAHPVRESLREAWWVLFVGWICHVFVVEMIGSSLWLPDFSLVALVLAVSMAPECWVWFSLTTGLFISVWVTRNPAMHLLSYLVLGWGLRILTRVWEIADYRVEILLVAVATCLMSLYMMWLENVGSLQLLGWISVRVAMNSISVPLLRRVTVDGFGSSGKHSRSHKSVL